VRSAPGVGGIRCTARRADALDEAATAVRSAAPGAEVSTRAVDRSEREGQEQLLVDAGEVDILVNNVGAIPAGDLSSVDNEKWRSAWELKISGYIHLCRLAYPRMTERGFGVRVGNMACALSAPMGMGTMSNALTPSACFPFQARTTQAPLHEF
jgi:3-oxoacyl-[acyl-carrier protein] reductase